MYFSPIIFKMKKNTFLPIIGTVLYLLFSNPFGFSSNTMDKSETWWLSTA